MSIHLGSEHSTDFELDDTVSFDHCDSRLVGTVVRVYSTRDVYHVEVNGERYEVYTEGDNPRKEASA